MSELDELFGEGDDRARPQRTRILALVTGGLFLELVGLMCTSVPGGLLVLMAWTVVEKDLDRIESGYLAPEHRLEVIRLQRLVLACIFLTIALFALQGVLVCTGVYSEQIWPWLIQSMGYEIQLPYEQP